MGEQATGYPNYIDAETRRFLDKARLMRRWGLLNVYTCRVCGAKLVTTDLDEGVTPFMTRCRVAGCSGDAESAMYRIDLRVVLIPTHAWYRPDALPAEDGGMHDYLRRGGLTLRELTADELAVW